MTSEEIREEIVKLESRLTGDFLKDMDSRDQIHSLEMRLNKVQSVNEVCNMDEGCTSCGS